MDRSEMLDVPRLQSAPRWAAASQRRPRFLDLLGYEMFELSFKGRQLFLEHGPSLWMRGEACLDALSKVGLLCFECITRRGIGVVRQSGGNGGEPLAQLVDHRVHRH